MTYALEQLGTLGSTMEPGESEKAAACAAILDLVTAAIAAPPTQFTGALRSVYGPGPAALWLTGERASVSVAGFHNAFIATRLDLDDGHRKARGHPGAAVIPAVFAEADRMAAEGQTVTDQAMLRAIVVGYELGLRIAAARGFYARTGFWAGFAAAAASGALRKLPAAALAHALAIGGETGPHMATTTAAPPWPQPLGSDVKEGIPWGVCAGLVAAALAEAGMTGPLDLVDHAPFFDKEAVLAVRPGAAIAEAYTKFYAACRHCHAPVDAFLEVVASNGITLDKIDTIHVGANSGAMRISNNPAPRNLVEAQYSIPYCLGLVAVDGAAALLPMTETSLGHRAAEAVARKVCLSIEPDCEARFPAETVVRVSVISDGRTYTSQITAPRGESNQAPSWDERLAKFELATAARLHRDERGKWRDVFVELRDGRLAALRQLLAIQSAGHQNDPRT